MKKQKGEKLEVEGDHVLREYHSIKNKMLEGSIEKII